MSVILFKVDVTNDNQSISKDHDNMIKAGSEIEFNYIPDDVQRLIKIGVAEEIQDEKDPENKDSEDPPADELPGDIDELKEMADELGIDYAANIGAKTLQERIQAHLEK